MEINCTLLIQMCNFGITCLILNRFLYRPVVHMIIQEREKRDLFHQETEQCKMQARAYEKQREDAWIHAQDRFRVSKPLLEKVYQQAFYPHIEHHELTDQEYARHQKKVTATILEKVLHD